MTYSDLYEKYVEDLTLEEIEWIKDHSFINNWVYFGRKIQLINHDIDITPLKNLDKSLYNSLDKAINEYYADKRIRTANKYHSTISKLFILLYHYIYNNEDISWLIENIFPIFASTHIVESDIRYNVFRVFYESLYFCPVFDYIQKEEMNDSAKYQYSNLLNEWRLWRYPLVRNIADLDFVEKDKRLYHYHMKRALIQAENGSYYDALKEIQERKSQLSSLPASSPLNTMAQVERKFSMIFYIYKLSRKIESDALSYNTFHEFVSHITQNKHEMKSIPFLKVIEMFLLYQDVDNNKKMHIIRQMLLELLSRFKNELEYEKKKSVNIKAEIAHRVTFEYYQPEYMLETPLNLYMIYQHFFGAEDLII